MPTDAHHNWLFDIFGIDCRSYEQKQQDAQAQAQTAQAQTIQEQLQKDAQQQQGQRWNILQEIQTKIFEVQQDVTVNKARTADRAFDKMDGYIRE